MVDFEDPDQQDIWNTVRALNDAWTKGNPEDLSGYFHDRMIAVTPAARQRLEGGAACVAGWKGFSEVAQIHFYEEIDPIIQVYGNAAVVAYDYEMAYDVGGQTIRSAGRDLFFFVKDDDQWWAVGDQFSPYPF